MAFNKDNDSGLSPELSRLTAQLAKDPKSKLFIPLAEEYMKAGMVDDAISTLDEGMQNHPGYMSARVLLGKAHFQKGDLSRAREQFEAVVKAVPDNLFAHKKLGEIFLAQGDAASALKSYRILSLMSPKDEELAGLVAELKEGRIPEQYRLQPTPAEAAIPEEPKAEPMPPQSAPVPASDFLAEPESFEMPVPEMETIAGQEDAADGVYDLGASAGDFELSEADVAPDEEGRRGGVYELDMDAGVELDASDAAELGIELKHGTVEAGIEEPSQDFAGFAAEPEQPFTGEPAVVSAHEFAMPGNASFMDEPDSRSAEPAGFGEDVPYQGGDAQQFDFDSVAAAQPEQEIFETREAVQAEPEPFMPEPEPFAPEQAAAAPSGFAIDPGASADIQDIFSSYVPGEPEEPMSGENAGVYELPGEISVTDIDAYGAGPASGETGVAEGVYELPDEISGSDFEAFGVKPAASVPAADAHMQDESPFEFAGEGGETVAGGIPFDVSQAEDTGEASPFVFPDEAEDIPSHTFDMSSAGTVEEEPYSAEPSFAMPEEEAIPAESPFGDFGEEAAFDDTGFEPAEAVEEAQPFTVEPAFAEAEPEPDAEPMFVEEQAAAPHKEPINTDTLAELYIKQGFYDRAISIYTEMLREDPGNTALMQKVEELHMLMTMAKPVEEEPELAEDVEAEDAGEFLEPAGFEPEGFDMDEPIAAEPQYEPSPEPAHVPPAAAGVSPAGDSDTARRLEEFLDNIKRKGRR